jgi:hypothetical protein
MSLFFILKKSIHSYYTIKFILRVQESIKTASNIRTLLRSGFSCEQKNWFWIHNVMIMKLKAYYR